MKRQWVLLTMAACLPFLCGCSRFSQQKATAGYAGLERRALNGETLHVAFLGGSLTWGAQATDPQRTSYRALVSQRLVSTYPRAHFVFHDAAIGGTGSQLAAFRLERDVLAHRPDLVFLDFTINDNPYAPPDSDKLASYESLVRRLVQAGVPVVQMILPAKRDVLPNPAPRPLDTKHKEIGEAYGLAIGDAVALVQSRVAEGKATPDQLWDVESDATHPGDAGYALYAEAAWQALRRGIEQKKSCRAPESMLHPDTYMTVNRFALAGVDPLPRGWRTGHPNRSAIAFDFTPSRWMDRLAIAFANAGNTTAPDSLVLDVRGSNLFFFGEATMKSGQYRVLIDGREVKTRDVGKLAPHGNWRYVEELARGLDASVSHRVEIIPILAPGQELRLESLCVAGAPARVEATR